MTWNLGINFFLLRKINWRELTSGPPITVVPTGRKQRVNPLQHASPTPAAYSPPTTGNSFNALADVDADDAPDDSAATSDDALYKAVIASYPDIGAILRRQAHDIAASSLQATTAFTSLMGLIKTMDGRLARMENHQVVSTQQMENRHVTSMNTLEERQVASMSQMEMRLVAKIDAFNGQCGDLRLDINDHERRLSTLNSDVLKQNSVLKGYRDTNDKLVATLRVDVNDTRARIPDLRRELQDSTAGLVTSIKDIEALVHEVRQQQPVPATHDSTKSDSTPADTPVRGASVNPPTTPPTP